AYTSMFHTNVMTAVTATKAVLGQVTPPAYLIYMASILALEPLPGMTAYTATKAALLALVRGLAHEVKGRGIHANAIVSSMVDSPHARASRPNADFSHAVSPEDIADVIGFLTSPAADALNGALVPVYGQFEFETRLAPRGPAGGTGGPGGGPGGPRPT